MGDNRVNVVTGAFGFTGGCIARRLLAMGEGVRTLTAHPDRPNEFGNSVQVVPFNFNNTVQLVESLKGASVLYNTYWIRFAHGPETFTFYDLVQRIKQSVRSGGLLLRLPPSIALIATSVLGGFVGDVVLTSDEVKGLEANLLVTDSKPTGTTRLSEWLGANADWLGKRYFSEVKKHF